MTFEQANEIIEFVNDYLCFRLPEYIIDHIAAIPTDPEIQSDYMFESAMKNNNEEYQNKIKEMDLTIGIFYFESDFVITHFTLLSEAWLENYDAHYFLPEKFKKLLSPVQSDK